MIDTKLSQEEYDFKTFKGAEFDRSWCDWSDVEDKEERIPGMILESSFY